MIKLLHYFLFNRSMEKIGHPSRAFPPFVLRIVQSLIILILFIKSDGVQAQQLDTWFTADRAVNLPPLPSPGSLELFTPYAPADGTPITIWYDFVDYVAQDAIPHPSPANYPLAFPSGFDYPYPNSVGFFPTYLNPTGSIPGVPTLNRNAMNFNPVARFDGSGDGQALHFQSASRKEITLLIVFKGEGAGNTAETQRLLFGGDVDVHHVNSFINEWTTNLSLGIAENNRFSVGRTWRKTLISDSGEFFQSGNIDLLRKPTIGTFQRTIGSGSERLLTHVNGIPDISTVRSHLIAENDLFFFNRLGKHFNSNDPNRNLTGEIAEVLLFDGPIPASAIQVAESYLAVKYGITLSNGPGLGSEVGNTNYNYLAADGTTIIWQAEGTYIYDIAGIGADRYEDFESNLPGDVGDLKLRFNLHQRISKSENPEAIVTISTNTNFTTDNLDNSRNIVNKNGESTYLHNFLLWGSDRGSINEIFTELPVGITSRIEREWRVQMNHSASLSPISGVSVRINLNGSDILAHGDCALKLMIDTDEDGDFTTGPITMIDATSVDALGFAHFDGVNFNHRDVFTVGFGDTVPPTASNPATITVCDSAPDSDISVVIDEDDNCAVDTVTYMGETSDGNTNPETITRTYRITDTSGNFTDVQQQILVFTTPTIDDIPDQTACDSYTLPIITGTNLSGNQAYYDLPGGPSGGGNQYAENTAISSDITLFIYDETGSVPNCFAEESFFIDITNQLEAGVDSSIDFCETGGANTNLFAALGPTADVGGTWTDDDSSGVILLDPTNVDFSSITAGNYHFTYSFPPIGGCLADSAQVTVTVQPAPDAGTDGAINICEGTILSDADLFAALGGTPDAGGTWSPAFAGAGLYTYTVPATAPCTTDATAQVTVTVKELNLTVNVQNESCWESMDGLVSVNVGNAILPVTVQLNSMSPIVFDSNSFVIENLSPGNYEMTVIDNTGCQTDLGFEIQSGGPNLEASVEAVYLCDANMPSNTIDVTLVDPTIGNDVLYALDSTDPNDFIMSPEFGNISLGAHNLSILHNNGCMIEIPFIIENVDPLELTLSSININEITANATGGFGPYTYYFDGNEGTSSNTYTINRSGTFIVKIVDNRGCESEESITLNLTDLSIPNFFTPNNDGQRDFWKPRNMELFPNIQTFIFDRYGRKIKIMGAMDKGWDGHYESKPLPSGDYWYIVNLNDGSGREYVGHFTLYR